MMHFAHQMQIQSLLLYKNSWKGLRREGRKIYICLREFKLVIHQMKPHSWLNGCVLTLSTFTCFEVDYLSTLISPTHKSCLSVSLTSYFPYRGCFSSCFIIERVIPSGYTVGFIPTPLLNSIVSGGGLHKLQFCKKINSTSLNFIALGSPRIANSHFKCLTSGHRH